MRNLLMASLTIAILAVMVTACSSDSGSEVDGGPRISFDQEYVHLGEATPDQRINYAFTFENVGDGPLIVHKVKIKTLKGC